MRAANRASLVGIVRRQGGLTRADLVERTGLSKTAISSLVTELLRAGVLREDADAGSGRRKLGLHVNTSLGVALGVELGTSDCRGVLTDISMTPLRHIERPVVSRSVEASVELIGSVAGELLAGESRPCLGLGVAVPGPTDAESERVVFSESLGWSDVPLGKRLSSFLPFPLRVINRPRAGALGEHLYGAGFGVQDVVYVSISDGIAAGIFTGGHLLTGAEGYSGEFGHTTVLIDGPECVCGNRGCLETVASLPAIRDAIRTRMAAGDPTQLVEPVAYRDIIAAAKDGDPLCLDEISKASRYVGIGVANLINLLNPTMVIIGGQLAEAGEVVMNTIRKTVQRRAFPLSFRNVQISRSQLGLESACIGACGFMVDRYFACINGA